MGCEPTYKELKRFEELKKQFESHGCEPTYKELKHVIKICFTSLIFGCEPTYKELKPELVREAISILEKLRAYL